MKRTQLLIADDSIASRLKIKKTLSGFDDFEFTEAKDGQETIDLLKTSTFDFLILDLLMPVVNGFKVLEFIKENNINIRTIVLSADTQTTTKRMCFELGAYKVVRKTLSLNEFKNTINSSVKTLKNHES